MPWNCEECGKDGLAFFQWEDQPGCSEIPGVLENGSNLIQVKKGENDIGRAICFDCSYKELTIEQQFEKWIEVSKRP
jgi:hypothetical protein